MEIPEYQINRLVDSFCELADAFERQASSNKKITVEIKIKGYKKLKKLIELVESEVKA